MNRKLSAIAAIVPFYGSVYASAQTVNRPVNPQSVPLTLYASCLSDAIASQQSEKDGTSIRFTCTGDSAKEFFDQLGRYGLNTAEVKQDDGTYRTRKVSDQITGDQVDFCWQRVGGPSGESAFGHGYHIYLPVGDFLNR